MTKSKEKRGPKPETVKIEGNWEDAVGEALEKKRPVGGWPKTDDEIDPISENSSEKQSHADSKNNE